MANNSFQSFVRKHPAIAGAATIIALAGLGTSAIFTVKDSSSVSIFECYSGTGCAVNGILTVDGVAISTGASLSLTSGDARYVNTSGDTMTGALAVKAAVSGSTIFSFGLGSCSNSTTSKLIYNNSTGLFSCATDQAGGGLTFTAKTADYTASNGDMVAADVTGGSFTVTLPAAAAGAQVGAIITKNNNTGRKTLTIKTPSASPLILDKWTGTGGATLTGAVVLFGTGDTLTLQSNGTHWFITPGNDGRKAHTAMIDRLTAQAISASSTEKVLFTATRLDEGQIADTATNNRIDIRRSGYYRITGHCSIATSASTIAECLIYKNNASIQGIYMEGTLAQEVASPIATEVYLSKGDYIEMFLNNQNGSPKNTLTSFRAPKLFITEIR